MADETGTFEAQLSNESNEGLSTDQISDVLNFDPFEGAGTEDPAKAPEADPSTKAAEQEAATGKDPVPAEQTAERGPDGKFLPKEGKAKKAAKAETPEPAAEPKTAEVSNEQKLINQQLKDLADQNRTLMETVRTLTENQAKAAPADTAPAGPAATVPAYDVNIPDQLMQMLDSEDQGHRRAAMAALVKATAQTVHQNVMQHVEQHINETVPGMVTGQVGQGNLQTEVFKDFYGSFKDLNNPRLRPLVVAEAIALSQETGVTTWSNAFRDALGARVKALIGGNGNAAGGLPPATAPAPQPPAQLLPGTQPPGSGTPSAVGPNSPADIAGTLFG